MSIVLLTSAEKQRSELHPLVAATAAIELKRQNGGEVRTVPVRFAMHVVFVS
jgi:hypothetical protein